MVKVFPSISYELNLKLMQNISLRVCILQFKVGNISTKFHNFEECIRIHLKDDDVITILYLPHKRKMVSNGKTSENNLVTAVSYVKDDNM